LKLFATYTGRQSDLGRWFGAAEVTTDRDLRLMYQAGWGINSFMADPIYRQMLQYREVPRDIFEGNPDTVASLLGSLQR
jgi:hypothetical protein